jgi:hypothetical protein
MTPSTPKGKSKRLGSIAAASRCHGFESTLPALCSLLDKPNKIREATTMTSRYELHDDPVGHAFFEIGDKAVPCLSSMPLLSTHTRTRLRAIDVLLRIGTPASRKALQQHLPAETDDMLRRYHSREWKNGFASVRFSSEEMRTGTHERARTVTY